MKHYIISYKKEEKPSVLEKLAAYNPKPFSLIERIAISIDDTKQESLLETLSSIPNITYREANTYKTNDQLRHKPNN